MKTDRWLLEKIIEEAVGKNDIAYLKKLTANGHSDDEILHKLRERMVYNSKGMLSYIRLEKVRALSLKLSYRIHWTYIIPVIKEWLREKEALIRWKENKHGDKVDKKAIELRNELLHQGRKVKCDVTDPNGAEGILLRLEQAAEELVAHIEKEEERKRV